MAERVDKRDVLQLPFDRAISAQAGSSLAGTTIAQRLQMSAYPALIDVHWEELVRGGFVTKADHGVRGRYKIPQWHIVKETLLLIASISTALALALHIAGMIS